MMPHRHTCKADCVKNMHALLWYTDAKEAMTVMMNWLIAVSNTLLHLEHSCIVVPVLYVL